MDKQEIIEYCLSFPSTYEDYSFGGAWSAIKHSSNRKCFAFVFERDGMLCVNLRCPPLKADFLRRTYEHIAPGYRMNRDYWNAVTVGGDVPDNVLRGMIEESYGIIQPKPKKSFQRQAVPVATKPCWPENLYLAVLGNEATAIPENAEEAIQHAICASRPREQAMIMARFRDGKTYKAIGAEHGITGHRVAQIIDRTVRRLRPPKRSRYLTNLDQALMDDRFAQETPRQDRRDMLERRLGERYVQDLESMAIDELCLSSRAHKRLLLSSILTLADLALLTLPELMNLRLLGTEAYDEIVSACEAHGISFVDPDWLTE